MFTSSRSDDSLGEVELIKRRMKNRIIYKTSLGSKEIQSRQEGRRNYLIIDRVEDHSITQKLRRLSEQSFSHTVIVGEEIQIIDKSGKQMVRQIKDVYEFEKNKFIVLWRA